MSHDSCPRGPSHRHECVHIRELTEADGVEDAEVDAAYESALKSAIRGVHETVTCMNEHLEDVHYEIEAIEGELLENHLTSRTVKRVEHSVTNSYVSVCIFIQ